MSRLRPLAVLAVAICLHPALCDDDILYEISDELYYSMPQLFHLDNYEKCLATGGVYCLGSFELAPAAQRHPLFRTMQRYSANYVNNFNHTRLHRGLCLTEHCDQHQPATSLYPTALSTEFDTWFSSCVNATTMSSYNLSAHLYQLNYCRRGPETGDERPLSAGDRGFAGVLAALLGLSAVSTALDLILTDHAKKGLSWALSWSLVGCWRALLSSPASSQETDLRVFDGIRVLCMMCVIIEHVVWINVLTYAAEPRYTELTRRKIDAMLMSNSTLVVQIFFLMSTFLLAHKLLQQRRRNHLAPTPGTFFSTMVNRILRISPSYFMVVWFAATWWARLGHGPMWQPLVEAESAICRRKWWTHLLYLNNILYADDKCLIQTWYLAADMQLYAAALVLTLLLWRLRGGALVVLGALMVASVALLFGLAYTWELVPTFVMHRPELVRVTYKGESSFNVLYQSPLGNVPGALAGLLLAHAHHHLLDRGVKLNNYKLFRWCSVAAVPLAFLWAGASPLLLGSGVPSKLASALLAGTERPIFACIAALALLGAINGISSPWQRVFSWSGWGVCARLSFGALLLHMPLNKSLVAERPAPSQLSRQTAIFEWFGVALVSYLAAIPLAMLVELPVMRLHRALTTPAASPKPPPPTTSKGAHNTDS